MCFEIADVIPGNNRFVRNALVYVNYAAGGSSCINICEERRDDGLGSALRTIRSKIRNTLVETDIAVVVDEE